jgi:hypothetical protein
MKNEYVHTEADAEGSSPRENRALWLGILGPPVIWLVQFQVSYMLVPWACSTGQHWTLHAASFLFLVMAAMPGWPAWRYWRAAGGERLPERQSAGRGRRQFMALLGLMMTGLFVLATLAQAIPRFVLNPCQQ